VTARSRRPARIKPPIPPELLLLAAICIPPLPIQAAWLANPALRVEPLAVIGEGERILAACPKAAAAGVRTGHRPAQARLLCPTMRMVTPDPDAATVLYEDVLAALGTISPVVEAADPHSGIVYLHGRGLDRLIGDVATVVQATRRAAAEIGLAVVSGAGPNRLLARVLAERAHRADPVTSSQAWQLLHALPLGDTLFTLAPPILQTLDDLGVRTAGALAALPRAGLVLRFDPAVLALWDVLHGAPEPPLRPWSQSPMRTERYASDDGIDDRLVLEAILKDLAETLLGQLHDHGEATSQLTLRIRRADGTRATARGRHWPPLCTAAPLARAALALLDRVLAQPTPEPIITLRLDAGELGPSLGTQAPLFGEPVAARMQRLAAVLTDQTDRHGTAVLGRWRADALAPDGWTHEDGLA
jgi:protein ImuB